MTSDGARRVVPLTFGGEHIPKSISMHGADPTVRRREPVPGVLLEVDRGWVLLDTGFNTPILLDGLVHESETDGPLTPGTRVRVEVLDIDVDGSRISLRPVWS